MFLLLCCTYWVFITLNGIFLRLWEGKSKVVMRSMKSESNVFGYQVLNDWRMGLMNLGSTTGMTDKCIKST